MALIASGNLVLDPGLRDHVILFIQLRVIPRMKNQVGFAVQNYTGSGAENYDGIARSVIVL
jgi:hypothetical protein